VCTVSANHEQGGVNDGLGDNPRLRGQMPCPNRPTNQATQDRGFSARHICVFANDVFAWSVVFVDNLHNNKLKIHDILIIKLFYKKWKRIIYKS
jgi:hypothetical protein